LSKEFTSECDFSHLDNGLVLCKAGNLVNCDVILNDQEALPFIGDLSDPRYEYDLLRQGNSSQSSIILNQLSISNDKWWFAKKLLSHACDVFKSYGFARSDFINHLTNSSNERNARCRNAWLIFKRRLKFGWLGNWEQYERDYELLSMYLRVSLQRFYKDVPLLSKSRSSVEFKLKTDWTVLDMLRCRITINNEFDNFESFMLSLFFIDATVWLKDFSSLLPVPKIIICMPNGACAEVQIYMSDEVKTLSEELDVKVYERLKERLGYSSIEIKDECFSACYSRKRLDKTYEDRNCKPMMEDMD
jgi:hypothetical protein